MTTYVYAPLETLRKPPATATSDELWKYVAELEKAIHELNSKITYIAGMASITIPSSGG